MVDRWLTGVVAHLLHLYSDLTERDLGGLLQLTGTYSVIELAVQPGDWPAGRRLGVRRGAGAEGAGQADRPEDRLHADADAVARQRRKDLEDAAADE